MVIALLKEFVFTAMKNAVERNFEETWEIVCIICLRAVEVEPARHGTGLSICYQHLERRKQARSEKEIEMRLSFLFDKALVKEKRGWLSNSLP